MLQTFVPVRRRKKNVGAPVQPWQTVSPEPRPKHHSQFVILTALNAVLTSVIIHYCVKYVHQHISQYASHLNSTALSLSSSNVIQTCMKEQT